MKILRLFDSLKFVRAMFVAVACVFILNVAHADTNAIQSVIAYGKTEQSATPTPTNPVPIMTNNGVLTASKNLFDATQLYGMYLLTDTGEVGSASSTYGLYRYFDVKPNTTYTFSYVSSSDSQYRRVCGYDNTGTFTELLLKVARSQGGVAGDSIMLDFTTGATTTRIAISTRVEDTNIILREKSVYTNGLTETIRDAAGHKATAQMLLSVGDYKDEQNITTGAITRRVGIKVLDGTESWATSTTYGANVFTVSGFLPDSLRISANSGSILFSTHFAPAPVSGAASNPKVNNTMSINSEYHAAGAVWIRSNNFSTVAQFKSWLAEQYANGTPVIVVYPLKASAQTTENVTTQQMTTAPVRQTAGSILGMPIEVILSDNTSQWVTDAITIATTKYNEESFAPVKTDLSAAVNAVEYVVSNTMSQAQQIDQIANEKQTRPDEGCDAKYCLLVEDEDGTPHWYPIAGANGVAHNLPTGYTELQYIESTGTQYIDTGIIGDNTMGFYIDAQKTVDNNADSFVFGSRLNSNETRLSLDVDHSGTAVGNLLFGWNAITPAGERYIAGLNRFNAKLNYMNDRKGIINGQEYPSYTQQLTEIGTDQSPLTLGMFSSNLQGSYAHQYGWRGRIWSFQITQGTSLVRNFVPAKRNSDNVLGMYDMVSGQFFTNAGTGTFTAGPDM